ncbi:GNAT family N-acetyltransferase [Bacillus suaedaesalsae]|uniref:GNAT family N-acetyltransferase n=1 Tax=Bacillus suaedaesalsae TaxID=2810349 RepID=A0ABS2DN63_9BACI|nr:GNAT family N-acetyltransferase [Bacillus suaedaesalsae]MBM6619470.1 GNAT family N-acetyltransferase [Bacillus suaedaesalsae]
MLKINKVTLQEKEKLGNLFEYYVYEFSPYLKIDIGTDGKFGFGQLNEYFTDSYDPYFIYKDDNLVGFCIVQKLTNKDYDYQVDQFFILKRYEGLGLGKAAAFQIFNQYKGRWNITQIETNYKAQAFWRGTIKAYTNNTFDELYDDNRRSVQRFQS